MRVPIGKQMLILIRSLRLMPTSPVHGAKPSTVVLDAKPSTVVLDAKPSTVVLDACRANTSQVGEGNKPLADAESEEKSQAEQELFSILHDGRNSELCMQNRASVCSSLCSCDGVFDLKCERCGHPISYSCIIKYIKSAVAYERGKVPLGAIHCRTAKILIDKIDESMSTDFLLFSLCFGREQLRWLALCYRKWSGAANSKSVVTGKIESIIEIWDDAENHKKRIENAAPLGSASSKARGVAMPQTSSLKFASEDFKNRKRVFLLNKAVELAGVDENNIESHVWGVLRIYYNEALAPPIVKLFVCAKLSLVLSILNDNHQQPVSHLLYDMITNENDVKNQAIVYIYKALKCENPDTKSLELRLVNMIFNPGAESRKLNAVPPGQIDVGICEKYVSDKFSFFAMTDFIKKISWMLIGKSQDGIEGDVARFVQIVLGMFKYAIIKSKMTHIDIANMLEMAKTNKYLGSLLPEVRKALKERVEQVDLLTIIQEIDSSALTNKVELYRQVLLFSPNKNQNYPETIFIDGLVSTSNFISRMTLVYGLLARRLLRPDDHSYLLYIIRYGNMKFYREYIIGYALYILVGCTDSSVPSTLLACTGSSVPSIIFSTPGVQQTPLAPEIKRYADQYRRCFFEFKDYIDQFIVKKKFTPINCLMYGLHCYLCEVLPDIEVVHGCAFLKITDILFYCSIISKLVTLAVRARNSWLEPYIDNALRCAIKEEIDTDATDSITQFRIYKTIEFASKHLLQVRTSLPAIYAKYLMKNKSADSLMPIIYFKEICFTLYKSLLVDFGGTEDEFKAEKKRLAQIVNLYSDKFATERLRGLAGIRGKWQFKRLILEFASMFSSINFYLALDVHNTQLQEKIGGLLRIIFDAYFAVKIEAINAKRSVSRDKPPITRCNPTVLDYINVFHEILPIEEALDRVFLSNCLQS